jgi:vacuolar-type H+-ATPase subunit E/Vma4
MDDDARLKSQLEPLAKALTATAHSDAQGRLDEARARATDIREDAASAAADILARAQAEGEAAAERESEHRLVAARREARHRVLEAQRRAYDGLFQASLAAVEGERGGPGYEALQERLEAVVDKTLGEDATRTVDPEGAGGVIGRSDGRCVDLTLPVLVRRCIEQMGEEVSRLWSEA